MGSYTITRPAGKKIRLAVQWGRDHGLKEVAAFYKALRDLTGKHKLKAKRPRPKK